MIPEENIVHTRRVRPEYRATDVVSETDGHWEVACRDGCGRNVIAVKSYLEPASPAEASKPAYERKFVRVLHEWPESITCFPCAQRTKYANVRRTA